MSNTNPHSNTYPHTSSAHFYTNSSTDCDCHAHSYRRTHTYKVCFADSHNIGFPDTEWFTHRDINAIDSQR